MPIKEEGNYIEKYSIEEVDVERYNLYKTRSRSQIVNDLLRGCVEPNPGPLFDKNREWKRIYKHIRGAMRAQEATRTDCLEYIFEEWYNLKKD